MTYAVVVVTIFVLALTTPCWWPTDPRLHRLGAAAGGLLLAGLWVSGLYVVGEQTAPAVRDSALTLLAVAAVVAGGPVTAGLLLALERPGDVAAEVLRGGAWIGLLERAAVFVCVLSGHPEAVALVVAVKGLGRYPELRSADAARGAAERFIAGTLASLLWAGTCALVALRLGS
ncbi:hypothetical protein [Nocardioides mangrovicus]|uniref:hypothetical protein n=1 Tax=Nocardioides mangrovicus TaxID=2478913 RepID=UPI0018E09B10|nr:hypothetical protein [Nocardioides mangrovicus]